jgi:hypothetical protein
MATKLGWKNLGWKPQAPSAPAGSSPAPTAGVFIKDGDGPWKPLLGDLQVPGDPIDDADLPWIGWGPK